MFTYLLVFYYTKNGNTYFTNSVVTQNQPFSVVDKERYELLETSNNQHRTILVNIIDIEPKPYSS